jgi:hypothetical protein
MTSWLSPFFLGDLAGTGRNRDCRTSAESRERLREARRPGVVTAAFCDECEAGYLSECGFPSSRRPETRDGSPRIEISATSGGAQTSNSMLPSQLQIVNRVHGVAAVGSSATEESPLSQGAATPRDGVATRQIALLPAEKAGTAAQRKQMCRTGKAAQRGQTAFRIGPGNKGTLAERV